MKVKRTIRNRYHINDDLTNESQQQQANKTTHKELTKKATEKKKLT